ncbi:MAG: MFS transporter [Deltaproteobacteria bacterium]|nr:MFS transporter [Deltaproteobacteria bacterium]
MESNGSSGNSLRKAFREVIAPFVGIAHTPRALSGVYLTYFLEGLVYFGVLTLLTKYFHENVALSDIHAGWIVGAFTGGITLAMFFLGEFSDRWGVRASLLAALALIFLGRLVISGGDTFIPSGGLWSPLFFASMAGLFLIVLGYGFYQPACYLAVRQFSSKEGATMGYALLYALMNLGAFLSGVISPRVRLSTEEMFPPNGVGGVFWIYVVLSLAGLLATLMIITKKSAGDEGAAAKGGAVKKEKWTFAKWWAEHPFRNARFVFFIFILIPVQTLFAHQWLTIPQYVERAYTGVVSENFEFFTNINPLLIFVLTPIVAALTSRVNVYTMMIAGTAVMALPTFLLSAGPNPTFLMAYILLMSAGEAMWSPRFLQWVAEVAPEGKTGAYMGIAQFPWFLTKLVTSTYSGWFLAQYCPEKGARDTETLWLIYGVIALATPLVLWIFRGWAESKR